MSTTEIVTVEDGLVVSEDSNYQGYTYSPLLNLCLPTNKRCIRKWAVVQKVFPWLVRDRAFMDIGASFGFFCFKALEHGARLSIGLEKHPPYHRAMRDALRQAPVPNLEWVNGSWPETGHKADVVMILSVIHHLFPKKSLGAILDDLYQSSNRWVIAEWIARDDKQVQRKGFAKQHPEYSHEGFLLLASDRFRSVEFLGNGHHKTRFVYLLEK